MSESNGAVADVLERAADLLWVRGRAIGFGERADGTVCPLGAIALAEGRGTDDDEVYRLTPAVRATATYLYRHPEIVPDEGLAHSVLGTVFRWNDTTEDDELVIDTMRRCAKEVRADA